MNVPSRNLTQSKIKNIGILFGNINALAMQPLGHLAGTGTAVVGSLSTLISMLLGTAIGQSYNGTVLPLVIGITVLTGMATLVARWAEARPQHKARVTRNEDLIATDLES